MSAYHYRLLFLFTAILNCTFSMDNVASSENQRSQENLFTDFISDFEEHWSLFKKIFSKLYNETEEIVRKEIFRKNRDLVQSHNSLHQQGMKAYSLRLNEFADWSDDEYQQLNGFMPPPNVFNTDVSYEYNAGNEYNAGSSGSYEEDVSTYSTTSSQGKLPASIDWRELGYVTSVKNQRQCGGCYSFAAAGALEALHKRVSGKLVSLSEQNILDCSWAYGNNGCDGGWMTGAYRYVKANGGIDSFKSYPYTAHATHKCKYTATDKAATDNGYTNVAPNEKSLKAAVGTVGPVSVAVMASLPSFKFYNSGVYQEPECKSNNLDHAVLVVGYGSDPQAGDYWIIKNSWGTDWGVDGYMYMARNQNNMCGVASMASYPTA